MPERGRSRGAKGRGHGHGKGHGHGGSAGGGRAARRGEGIGDGAVYFLFLTLGVCIGFFAWLIAGGSAVPWIVGYVLAVLWLLNMSVIKAYRGGSMAPWQKSLARLPLRPAGFGVRGGKPVEAAHGEPVVRTALITTACVSVAIAAVALAIMARVLS
ncbi:MAG: hypothetical protein ACYTEV_11955 [Planctomycetota bacterium]|jgi:hypothetical protein